MKNLLLIFILILGCHKPNNNCFKIRSHYSIHGVSWNNEISGTGHIDCYSVNNQINKFVGIKPELDHHENSVRIGWMDKPSNTRLYTYYYINGVRDSSYLKSIDIGSNFDYTVKITKTTYYVSVDEVEWTKDVNLSTFNPKILYPYYGGSIGAPVGCEVCLN